MVISFVSVASVSEFEYDKGELQSEFRTLDNLSSYLDKTNLSYAQVSELNLFEGDLELTNSLALKPNLKLDEVDWGAFAWGFCCWPIGIFTVAINDDKDKNSKNSFVAGVVSSVIAGAVAYVVFYAATIVSLSIL